MGVVEIRDLSFSYPNGRPALHSVNLTVGEGEFVGVMGPSPSGKSTLAYCMAGLIPNCIEGEMRGSVVVDGLDTREHTIAELSRRVGIVFQDPEAQLLELRVVDEVALPLENLGLPPEEIGERVREALEVVGLRGYEERCPTELSGGEKQRLAIASVLALRPKVIVLDEPTANVDLKGTAQVYETLCLLNREHGLTVIVIENKVELVRRYAERAVLMRDGRIVADGPADEVLSNRPLLERLDLESPPRAQAPERREASGRSESCADPELIRFENVTYRYPDGTVALRGVSLVVSEGERLFLMGENGSGKSTLVKHMNGLLKPTEGRVLVNGVDTRECPTYKLSRVVGLVFQNPAHQIVGSTVYDEIALGLRSRGLPEERARGEALRVAKAFGLEDKLDMIPEELSTGELKRLMVASVVAMRPKVIVLDEPMTGMTRAHSRRVLDSILSVLGHGVTLVAITHDPVLAMEYATRVVLMSEGRVVAEGEPELVLGAPEFSQYLEEAEVVSGV